jgi:hypothetical protein
VQATINWVVGTYLLAALRTTRWRLYGEADFAPFARGEVVIAAFWHERLALMPMLWIATDCNKARYCILGLSRRSAEHPWQCRRAVSARPHPLSQQARLSRIARGFAPVTGDPCNTSVKPHKFHNLGWTVSYNKSCSGGGH